MGDSNTNLTPLYHEKQSKRMCAIHTLNNLFQENAFDQGLLDTFCNQLAPQRWLNPHKSILGIGDYDVNVLDMALQSKGYVLKWFDSRQSVDTIDFSSILGLICNIKNSYLFGYWESSHWFSIRKISGNYYNLDSRLENPKKFHDLQDLQGYLNYIRTSLQGTILLVVKME